MPQAENTEAPAGTTTFLTPSSAASATPCIAAAAAERDQREVARIVAAVERHQLQRIDHVVVGDADDAARRLVGVDAELFADRRRCAASAAAMSAMISPPQK